MRVAIHAVGRLKAGPEQELAARYLDRFAKAGPALGLEWAGVTEVAESRAQTAPQRKAEEARALSHELRDGRALVLLDEAGKAVASEAFAALLARLRDDGAKGVVFAIGGPDGHDDSMKPAARHVVSLGAMTWPHQVARILLAEQLYRAVTILSGHPYHRA